MRTIKIGTAFSGIGAFEQALKKLGIRHEIAFACDNGNIRLEDIISGEQSSALKLLENPLERLKFVEGVYSGQRRRKNFVKTSYMANYHLEEESFYHDVRFIGSHINKNIDIFVGGSPCQSFSIAGARGGFEDTRGTLFFEFARCVKEFSPQVFIFENVKGLLSHDNGKTYETVINTFKDLGYKCYSQVLNAKDYGIPQNRQRVFVVGFKDHQVDFQFPQKFPLTKKVVDLLETTLPVAQKYYYDDDKGITNANVNILRKREVNGVRSTREHKDGLCPTLLTTMGTGGNNVPVINEKYFLSKKMAEFVMRPHLCNKNPTIDSPIAKTIIASMAKMHRASEANYITTQGRLRKLTPRECLRLMGFPDDFQIVVSDAQAYKQAGNSIVVDVLERIVEKVVETGVFNKKEAL